jgi:CheY-like chemotaxis protein/transcriptional regulator with XRE-family HTH domain
MMTNEGFLEHLRDALNHLYEPDRLRRNPLAALFGVANRLDTFSALQEILTKAIESLEPDAGEPPQSPAWEVYEPLYHRYVQQLTQSQVAKQLGMSVRHLRRKEHAALEVLAARLWKQFDLEAQQAKDTSGEPARERPGEDSPAVSQELAWLKDAPPDKPLDLEQALSDVLRLARPLAAQRGIHLVVEMADPLPDLAVHEVAISQALLNVIGVAIRRASGGEVSIWTQPLPLEVEIRIVGVKVSPGDPPIEEDDAASLSVARQLAEFCGGRLAVSDDERAFCATMTVPAMEQLPVLVIDDNADTLQLLRRYTAGTRYQLITTQDPTQALSLAERFTPRLVVLDVMMPQMDGWKVLAQLRQNPLTGRVPIIICTIIAQQEMALALGASDFVRKPVTRQAFLSALDRQVQQMEIESG